MRNLQGLFLVLLILAFCIADVSGAEPDTRGQPKGCKRMNNWRKNPKFFKEGTNVSMNCKIFTCTQPKPRKFVWVDVLDTMRCCSFHQTFYPIGSKILCDELPDECTTLCVECVREGEKATLDLGVEDDCPEHPPETKVITEVPFDIKSPRHPNPYPPKQDICWSWTPICGYSAFLEFFDFDVLGHDAYITIDPLINGQSKFWGNRFNSENAPPKTMSFPCDTVVMICFHSEKIVNGHTGFSAEIVDNPCTGWINSPNFNPPIDFYNCGDTPSRGYGSGIHHCDVRATKGDTLNLDFCQFDIEGDYLTIHPNPTGKSKYYGTSLKEANAPPKWSEYPGAGYLTVCFKTRQTVDDHNGYSAEIYPTVATTSNEPGSETYEYYSPSQGQQSTTTTTSTTPSTTTTLPLMVEGCGPINSSDLAHGKAKASRNRLSDEEEREQMRIGLAMETGEDKRGNRIITREPGRRWPNGVVPYILSCSFDEDDRGVLALAFDNIEQNSCVRFRYATVEDRDYLTINSSDSGCYVSGGTGYLGPSRGEHILNLQKHNTGHGTGTCIIKGTIVHELMHSLGFYHEQTRPDRDDYLTVDWVNMQLASASQHWKNSWTLEEQRISKVCTRDGFTQETANFDDCVSGNIVTDYGVPYDFDSIMHYALTDFHVEGFSGNVLNPKNTSVTSVGGTELSANDILRLQRAYGCGACGGQQYSSTGGNINGNGNNTSQLCEWVLQTDSGKGISIDIESFHFDGDCKTNFLEVRMGKNHGDHLIKRYCSDSQPTGAVSIKSTMVWIGWNRTLENTIFSGSWTTFKVSCCDKVLFENHLQRNGFYEKDGTSISTGPIYKKTGIDQKDFIYYGRVFVDSVRHNGWIVGPEVGLIGVSNLDPVTCPEDAQSPWRSYDSSAQSHVDVPSATVTCSDCQVVPTAAECVNCCDEVTLSSTDATFLASSSNFFTGKYFLHTSTPTLNGRKVYQFGNTQYCMYFTSLNTWHINKCTELGSTSFFIGSTVSVGGACAHNSLFSWKYGNVNDPTMKVECLSSCTSEPPAAPSTATSNWDSSTKTVGTVVTYTCPDTRETRTVCDAQTLAWSPDSVPDC